MTMVSPQTRIHLTEELVVEEPASGIFYDLYLEVFGPLRYLAAARHLLDRHEWDEEMADQRVMKIVAWDDATPVGMALLALDLAAVPWASPDFYEAHYPGRAIYYCGVNLVLPAYQGNAIFGMMTRRAFQVARRDGALGAWDCSTVTKEQTRLIEKLISVADGHYPFEPRVVDTQSYYVVDPSDLPESPSEVAPQEPATSGVIDLRKSNESDSARWS